MFTSPLFLIAAAVGALVPLVLHLMQNKRRVVVPFPTLRFLKLAARQSSRRIRLEHLLLWLIRTVIMVLLGLAFTMPMLRSKEFAWLGRAPRDIAILLDASYSMGYRSGRHTVWEKSMETAEAIIQGLGEKDRYCLYLFREEPEPLIAEPVGEKENGIRRLKAASLGAGSSELSSTLAAVHDVLKKQKGRREQEIYILTDNQALPWETLRQRVDGGDGEAKASAEGEPVSEGDPVTYFVGWMGVKAPLNVSPADVEMNPPMIFRGSPAEIKVDFSHNGPEMETTATLFIDEAEAGRRQVRLGAAHEAAATFPVAALEPGLHTARIETPEDGLAIDNAFHFLVRVQDELPVLCVGSEQDTLFVRAALEAGLGGEPARIPTEGITDESLPSYVAVFLCNALPVSGQALAAVAQYVGGGGMLVLFPGDHATVEDYRAWTCLPGVPAAIRDLPIAERRRTLAWGSPEHALVRPLRTGLQMPVFSMRRSLFWSQWDEQATRILTHGPAEPFLLEREFGRGRVLLFAVTADRTWSDFPLSPYYLPLLVQAVNVGAGTGLDSPYIVSTQSLNVTETFPEATRDIVIRLPGEEALSVRSSLVDGVPRLHAEGLTAPGHYEVSPDGVATPAPALAVNLDRKESDLTPLPVEEVSRLLGPGTTHVATDTAGLLQIIEQHRIGRTYGEHLLWAAVLLVVLEFFYANSLLRSGPRLTEALSVDAAGRVRQQAVPGLQDVSGDQAA
jgi:hypothetical protein